MKPLLIVVSPSTGQHQTACKAMKEEAKKIEPTIQQFHETGFLLSGPRSFEAAMLLCSIADKERLPVSVFEIESVLTPLKDQEDSRA